MLSSVSDLSVLNRCYFRRQCCVTKPVSMSSWFSLRSRYLLVDEISKFQRNVLKWLIPERFCQSFFLQHPSSPEILSSRCIFLYQRMILGQWVLLVHSLSGKSITLFVSFDSGMTKDPDLRKLIFLAYLIEIHGVINQLKKVKCPSKWTMMSTKNTWNFSFLWLNEFLKFLKNFLFQTSGKNATINSYCWRKTKGLGNHP